MTALTLAVGPYAHTAPLLDPDRPVAVAGHDLRPVRVDPIIAAYRRMVRDLEFDVAELAPTTYVMARAAGLALIAVPVFLNRRFHHDDLRCNPDSGLRVPADLTGRRVGVRAYSVTTGVWVRGLLAEDFDVDNDKITWVVDDEEHVPGFVNPPNVEPVTDGSSLGAMVADGRIDAALGGNAGTGRAGKPREGWTAASAPTASETGPYPLFGAPDILARDWYRRTHIYPAHSLIVMRAELARAEPDLPTALYHAFSKAKAQAGTGGDDATSRRLAAQSAVVGGDGLPYGVDNNRPTLEALIRFARDQHLLANPLAVSDLFAPGDYPEA
jgi:4,5-dihydroxyphthalate decarboxylase